jgi:type I restriction enzyme S subunit
MSEWTTARLADVADIRFSNVDKKAIPGEAPVRLCNYMDVYTNDYITAELPFMEATASSAESERFRVEKGDVLLTKDSETPDDIGVPAVVVDDIPSLVCGYHLALIKPRKDRVDSTFLAKQLGSKQTATYFSQLANGSTRYGLSSSAIANTPIPLAPLSQQRWIAEVLLTLDETIEQTEALIAKMQQVKAGLMHDLLTRGVTPDGHLRPTREQTPDLYKESPLGWIPKEWDVATLSERGRLGRPHLKTGPFGSSLKIEHWVEDGHPVITIGALGEGELIQSELLYVSDATAQRLREYQLEVGDVVFSRVADVGRSAVVLDNHKGWIMSSNLMRISLDQAKVYAAYLQAQLAYDARVRAQIRATVNSSGREVANSQMLNRLLFVWPQPEEQARILNRVEALDAKRKTETAHLDNLIKQKQGLMNNLLTGRVRVTEGIPGGTTA